MPDISIMTTDQLILKGQASAVREFQFASVVAGLYDWKISTDQRRWAVVMAVKTGLRDHDCAGLYTYRFYQEVVADRMLVELQIKCAAAILCGESPYNSQVFLAVANRWREHDAP